MSDSAIVEQREHRQQTERIVYVAVTAVMAALIVGSLWVSAVPVEDWWHKLYPAARNWIYPYTGEFHFVYPPWMAVTLAPFGLFPVNPARALFAGFTLIAAAYTIRVLGGNLISLLLLIWSPPFLYIVANGQVDGVPLLGLGLVMHSALPLEVVGSMLLLSKPQVLGMALPLVWLKSEKRWHLTGLVAALILLSLLMWGWWPGAVQAQLGELYRGHDISIFPYGIPVGLVLMGFAYRHRSIPLAAVSTFFFVPYVNTYSLTSLFAILFARLPVWASLILLAVAWIFLIGFNCIASVTLCTF